MLNLKTLLLQENIKTILVEEENDAPYGQALIAWWLQSYHEKKVNSTVELLSFSDPELWFSSKPHPYTLSNVKVKDYYTLGIGKFEENFNEIQVKILNELTEKSVIIVNSLDSLMLYWGVASALKLIEKISKQVAHFICLYRKDSVQCKLSCLNTFGNVYLKIQKSSRISSINEFTYIVKYVYHKSSGSVLNETELVTQDIITYEIVSEKLKKEAIVANNHIVTQENPKIESSFRIEISKREMEQRENTPLPYVPINNPVEKNTSKILYVPDEVDDLDEEDPDDDLCI